MFVTWQLRLLYRNSVTVFSFFIFLWTTSFFYFFSIHNVHFTKENIEQQVISNKCNVAHINTLTFTKFASVKSADTETGKIVSFFSKFSLTIQMECLSCKKTKFANVGHSFSFIQAGQFAVRTPKRRSGKAAYIQLWGTKQ